MNIEEVRLQLDKDTKELNRVALDLTPNERKERVNELVERFYNATGRYPDSYRLTILANVILVDDIKDKSPDKISKKEYPFLSDRQTKTRAGKEVFVEESNDLDFLHQKHVKNMSSAFKKRTKNKQEV